MRYARLHHKAGESNEVAALLETEPLAVGLFFLSLARADVYGILPGDARQYRSHVAPAAILSPERVEAAIQAQERVGLVKRYQNGTGKPLLHILKYHEYQIIRWANRIGPPENELPDWWEAPPGFTEWLVSEECSTTTARASEWQLLREHYCSKEQLCRFAAVALRSKAKLLQEQSPAIGAATVVLQQHAHTQDIEATPTDSTPSARAQARARREATSAHARARDLGTRAVRETATATATAPGNAVRQRSGAAHEVTGGAGELQQPTIPHPNGGDDAKAVSMTIEQKRERDRQLWLRTHGPPPERQDRRDEYIRARDTWMAALPGPCAGYEFPPLPD